MNRRVEAGGRKDSTRGVFGEPSVVTYRFQWCFNSGSLKWQLVSSHLDARICVMVGQGGPGGRMRGAYGRSRQVALASTNSACARWMLLEEWKRTLNPSWMMWL